jgi:CheY-like chemotaxis protein
MKQVRLIRKLANVIYGIDLANVKPGDSIRLSSADARLLIAEGWATPDEPAGTEQQSAAGQRSSPTSTANRSEENPLMKGRVLLVTAPGVDRDLYVSALTDAGFSVTSTRTVQDAATCLVEGDISLIALDLLPEPEQAWEFINQRATSSRGAPIVVFTSLIRPDGANRRRARTLGCAAFLAKPCSLRQLVNVVSRVHQGERGLEISTYDDYPARSSRWRREAQ